MNNVVDLPRRPSARRAMRLSPCGMEVVTYLPAAIHESVPISALVSALTAHGLTLSNVAGHGIVIHPIGQDPLRPNLHPPGAS